MIDSLMTKQAAIQVVTELQDKIDGRDTTITILILLLAAAVFGCTYFGMKVYNAKKNGLEL